MFIILVDSDSRYIGNSDGSSFDYPRFTDKKGRLYISDQQWSDHLQMLPAVIIFCTYFLLLMNNNY